MKQEQRAFRMKNRRQRAGSGDRNEREGGYGERERRTGGVRDFGDRKSAPKSRPRNQSRTRSEEGVAPAGEVRMRKREKTARTFVPRPNSERKPEGGGSSSIN